MVTDVCQGQVMGEWQQVCRSALSLLVVMKMKHQKKQKLPEVSDNFKNQTSDTFIKSVSIYMLSVE